MRLRNNFAVFFLMLTSASFMALAQSEDRELPR